MHVHRTAALLALVTVLVAGVGVATATDAPPAVQAENATVDHGGGAVTLVTGPSATVTGETSLEPGTNLSVILRSSDAERPFLLTNETTAGKDGRFVTTFDLADVPDGANATLVVRGGDERLAEVPADLVQPTPTAAESPTPAPTGVPTESPAQGDTSSGDGPGFGALLALAAVLGTALVAAHRA